ncbi:hypothetical protein [Demequina sp. NBRC 110054]|uniref:hypothetical protein n=1 Tax=Demequina sp. NBRC 110054 TaxID=1570343 RepID=UPI0009FE19A9|nr:hypothetical protein [Demequina sp. NBRC 110054]
MTVAAISTIAWGGAAYAGDDEGEGKTPEPTPVVIQSEHKVQICHRTKSESNPYTENWVDWSSVGGVVKFTAGHEDHGTDIIPPIMQGGEQIYAGLNWTTENQAMWRNGCKPVDPTPELKIAYPKDPKFTDECNPPEVVNNVEVKTFPAKGVTYETKKMGDKVEVWAYAMEGYIFQDQSTAMMVGSYTDSGERCPMYVMPAEVTQVKMCGVDAYNDMFKVDGQMLEADVPMLIDHVWYTLTMDDGKWKVSFSPEDGYTFKHPVKSKVFHEEKFPCPIEPVTPTRTKVCGIGAANDIIKVGDQTLYLGDPVLINHVWYKLTFNHQIQKWFVTATPAYGYYFEDDRDQTEVTGFFEARWHCPVVATEPTWTDTCGAEANTTAAIDGTPLEPGVLTPIDGVWYRLTYDSDDMEWTVTAYAPYGYAFYPDGPFPVFMLTFTHMEDFTDCIVEAPEVLYLPKCNPEGVLTNDLFLMMVDDEPMEVMDGDVIDGVMYSKVFDEPTGMWTLTGTATEGYALGEGTWEWTGTEYTGVCLGTTPLTTPTLTIETSCEAGFSLDAEYATVPEDTVTFDVYIGDDMHFTLDDDTGLESYMWSVSEGLPTTGYDWTVEGTYQGQTETLATGTQDTCVEPEGGELAGGETKTTEPVTTTTKVLSATAATAVTATPTYTG